jgi:hypothetical protein
MSDSNPAPFSIENIAKLNRTQPNEDLPIGVQSTQKTNATFREKIRILRELDKLEEKFANTLDTLNSNQWEETEWNAESAQSTFQHIDNLRRALGSALSQSSTSLIKNAESELVKHLNSLQFSEESYRAASNQLIESVETLVSDRFNSDRKQVEENHQQSDRIRVETEQAKNEHIMRVNLEVNSLTGKFNMSESIQFHREKAALVNSYQVIIDKQEALTSEAFQILKELSRAIHERSHLFISSTRNYSDQTIDTSKDRRTSLSSDDGSNVESSASSISSVSVGKSPSLNPLKKLVSKSSLLLDSFRGTTAAAKNASNTEEQTANPLRKPGAKFSLPDLKASFQKMTEAATNGAKRAFIKR